MKKKAILLMATFAVLVLLFPGFSHGAIPASERAALIALYNGADGAEWTDNSGWKTPPLHTDGFAMPGTEGSWEGVGVTGNNVTSLLLGSNQLNGTIPSQLGNLSELKVLYLDDNQLSGSIPSQLGNLGKLSTLILEDNQLSGSIPSQLGNLSELEWFFLSNNQLSGSIPSQLGNLAKLTYLYLDHNQLSGTIPTCMTNLTKISGLDIGYNCLSAMDTNLRAWLGSHDPDWETTQCLSAPEITTTSISSITANSAVGGGNVTSDGGSPVTARGVCWSTGPDPLVSGAKTVDGSGTGSFTSTITGLSGLTTYYVRAYATNIIGTAYGSATNFTTPSNLPELDPPFGSFDTPNDGSTVAGSIAVTGWALDDGGLASVKIYLSEGNTQIPIGDALFVEGARPDIVTAYPDYPANTKAGWGYMMLTNFLPGGGNGTYALSAIATDLAGKTTVLGTKTIIADNAHAVKPFGAIDTPGQGGTAGGSAYRNWGWVLTPQPNQVPTDGATINAWIDGVNIGHPKYNLYRSDVASLFPGYANSDGAAGYLDFDTTPYSSGTHTISWTVKDSGGNSDGIGSRYFTVQNTGNNRGRSSGEETGTTPGIDLIDTIPTLFSEPIQFNKGFNTTGHHEELLPDEKGICLLVSKELERVEIQFGQNHADIQGFILSGSQLYRLPIGSTVNAKAGTFSWCPGPGFLGRYPLIFILTDANGEISKKLIDIKIVPKFNEAQ